MKKFKLIALSLLAATFGLTSCELPDFVKKIIPGMDEKVEPTPEPEPEPQLKPQPQPEVVSVTIRTAVTQVTDETNPFKLVAAVVAKNGASNKVTWSSSNSSVGTIDQNGLFTPVAEGKTTITAVSQADSSKKDSVEMTVVAIPGVLSVTIQNAPTEINLYPRELQLEAVVAAKGTATRAVSWKSSNEEVATINDDGVATLLTEGTVKFTVASRFDASKTDEVEITIYDKGFDPSFIEEGYTYYKTFPEEQIRQVLGAGDYELYDPETEGGYYFVTEEGSALVLANSADSVDYAKAVYSQGVDRVASYATQDGSASGYVFVDETDYYTCYAVNETVYYESVAPMYLTFARSEYCWYDSYGLTEDTSWSEEHFKESYDSQVVDYLNALPFVQMGLNYQVEYVYSSSIFGTFEYLEIYDFTIAKDRFADYGNVLVDQYNATKVVDEYGDATYRLPIDDIEEFNISFGFSANGNTLIAEIGYREYNSFPSGPVDRFVSETVKSDNVVPAFNHSGATYRYDEGVNNGVDTALVYISEVSNSAEFFAYADSLAGFEVIKKEADDKNYDSFLATKGRLSIQGVFVTGYDDDYEPTEYGAVYLYIFADTETFEKAGLYVPAHSAIINNLGDKYDLGAVAYELGDAAIHYESSDSEVATVSEEGIVTAVAEGDAKITVSVSFNETNYEEVVSIHVNDFKGKLANYLAEAAEYLGLEEIVLPDMKITGFDDDYCKADDDYGCFCLAITSDYYADDYLKVLDQEGFVVDEDEGCADNGIVYLEVYDGFFDDNLYIDIYPTKAAAAEEFEDSVTFSELEFANQELVDVVDLDHCYITFDQGGASTATAYYDSGTAVRTYAQSTITVTAAEGGKLYEIAFNLKVGKTGVTGIEASVGAFDSDECVWTAPEGGVESVTFTVLGTAGHYQIKSIEVSGLGFENSGSHSGGGEIDELIEAVCEDLSYAVFDSLTNVFKLSDEGDYFYTASPGSTDEYTLLSAVELVLDNIATYGEYDYIVTEEATADKWDDGDDGVFAKLSYESVIVEVGSYVSGDDVVVQVVVK